ncbi:hypothetical protein, conserved in T. vivax [Trypanosoma vivax Y486]|uniref:Uncharacterized protein n=1 Tax=Trypanosoma vivax (strain Y486) TaxID=1055687 RepID=F9WT68_TRYVY|nr:hypothetical protein, conserved in T. vivax [Trypanosoma vivax Y486]|eukprot:CCD20760.1 hypothetical protein, conserved in T. vivax [Trypanosoma vivax Y486]
MSVSCFAGDKSVMPRAGLPPAAPVIFHHGPMGTSVLSLSGEVVAAAAKFVSVSHGVAAMFAPSPAPKACAPSCASPALSTACVTFSTSCSKVKLKLNSSDSASAKVSSHPSRSATGWPWLAPETNLPFAKRMFSFAAAPVLTTRHALLLLLLVNAVVPLCAAKSLMASSMRLACPSACADSCPSSAVAFAALSVACASVPAVADFSLKVLHFSAPLAAHVCHAAAARTSGTACFVAAPSNAAIVASFLPAAAATAFKAFDTSHSSFAFGCKSACLTAVSAASGHSAQSAATHSARAFPLRWVMSLPFLVFPRASHCPTLPHRFAPSAPTPPRQCAQAAQRVPHHTARHRRHSACRASRVTLAHCSQRRARVVRRGCVGRSPARNRQLTPGTRARTALAQQ